MANIDQTFNVSKKNKKEAQLERENRRLKAMIGELTIELKKSEEEWL